MSRDEEKLIRQLSLLACLLSRPRPFTAREIQESVEGYWGMNDETFTRRFHGDRADLSKIGIEIRTGLPLDAGEATVYYLSEDEYRLPSIDLTPVERRSLAVALAALEGRFAYARPLRLALAAISHGLPERIRCDLREIPVALSPDEDALQCGRQLARIEDAIARGKSVGFTYPSASGLTEDRRLDPYSLLLIQSHWYVVGFDQVRAAIRTFRVGRIIGPVRFLTGRSRDFAIPEGYDPNHYRARPPWLIGSVKGVATVRVDGSLSWWVSRLAPHTDLLSEDDDGSGYFSMPYADEEMLLAWVVCLDGRGELLEPRHLRSTLVDRLMATIRNHEGGPQPVETPAETVAGGGPGRPKAAGGTAAPIAPEHLARAISLLQYIVDERTPPVIGWAALEKDLGLSRSEIEADLRLINLVNFGGGTYVVFAECDDEGVRVTPDMMADAFSKPARLSPLMTRALLLALDIVDDAVDMDGTRSLASARDKIRQAAGCVSTAAGVVVDDAARLPPGLLSLLNRCISRRLVVELEYFTSTRGKAARRHVEPYLLFRAQYGWYLEAYCREAEAQRTFRLEFVRAAVCTDEAFVPRAGVDLSSRAAGAPFHTADSVDRATVRLTPRWRRYLEDRAVKYEVLSDGSLRGRIAYLDGDWMALEVLRFLGEATLESPSSLRSRVRELAASRLDTYTSGDTSQHASQHTSGRALRDTSGGGGEGGPP